MHVENARRNAALVPRIAILHRFSCIYTGSNSQRNYLLSIVLSFSLKVIYPI